MLHFSGGTQDFVFKGGKNYKVSFTNAAKTFTSEHFQYFHRIMGQPPSANLIPVGAVTGATGNLYDQGRPDCMIGWFSRVIYQILTGHLDW